MTAYDDIRAERVRQVEKWGTHDWPDWWGVDEGELLDATLAKHDHDFAHTQGRVTWRHILNEEVLEVFAETEPARIRAELVQVAAVAVQWIEAIDRRTP